MFKLIGTAFLEASKLAAGYPKNAGKELLEPKIINKLGGSKPGSGHDCFLKGICVQVDVTATSYQWQQIQRYHFFDIVSSQSKMHCITEFDIENQVTSNVLPQFVEIAYGYIDAFKKGEITREKLLDNFPMGFQLTARCVTNYLQLKTMYAQRHDHRLEFWNTGFVKFCDELPEFFDLTGVKNNVK